MVYRNINLLSWIIVLLLSCNPDMPEDVAIEYRKIEKSPDFNKEVKPILSDKCFSCHGPDKAKQKAGF